MLIRVRLTYLKLRGGIIRISRKCSERRWRRRKLGITTAILIFGKGFVGRYSKARYMRRNFGRHWSRGGYVMSHGSESGPLARSLISEEETQQLSGSPSALPCNLEYSITIA